MNLDLDVYVGFCFNLIGGSLLEEKLEKNEYGVILDKLF